MDGVELRACCDSERAWGGADSDAAAEVKGFAGTLRPPPAAGAGAALGPGLGAQGPESPQFVRFANPLAVTVALTVLPTIVVSRPIRPLLSSASLPSLLIAAARYIMVPSLSAARRSVLLCAFWCFAFQGSRRSTRRDKRKLKDVADEGNHVEVRVFGLRQPIPPCCA